MKLFIFFQPTPFPARIIGLMAILLLSPLAMAHSMEPDEEEIETLDVIEITGSVVEQTRRELNFPIPEIQTQAHLNLAEHFSRPELKLSKQIPTASRILLDQTAKDRNIHTPVKPLKTERPQYPRQAREQGWHGRVIIRLEILPDGTVESGTIQKSSGYQLLDDKAIKTATQWIFDPAKNGGFPVATTVNIPIQFDLIK